MEHHSERIRRCMTSMQQYQMDQMIITSKPNLIYLTGQPMETGERMTAMLLRGGESPKLFIHEMFSNALFLPSEIEIVLWKDEDQPINLLASQINGRHILGIDQSWPSTFLIDLLNKISDLHVKKSTVVEKLREIKDEGEITTLRQSARIADAVMHQVIQLQHFPATERQMAETIQSFFNSHGVHDLAFKPIIGFGKNSANPHHEYGDAGIRPDEAIVIDMGGVYRNYCSDITRNVFYGRKNLRYEEIYHIVKETQEKAVELVKPGMRLSDIDLFIRKEFRKWGYDSYFTHRTGHGLGLELHEGPFLHSNNSDEIQKGMVFSIEPGIYLPEEFGVRIEDIVVVTDKGCEVLTLSPKEVHVLDLVEA